MEDVVVTRLWMAGIVGLMAVYAVFALVGISKRKRSGDLRK